MKRGDVAIVGMAGVFPGAGDVGTFWKNIEANVDAIQTVPADRLEAVFFDHQDRSVDRFYCRRGGFIGEFKFDPVQFGILPLAVEGTEPDHLLALQLAHKALEDAGIAGKDIRLERTGIIIGKGNYAGPGATRAIEIVRTGEQVAQLLRNLLPDLKDEEIDKVKKEFQLKKGRFSADTVMGLIPNLVASLVANRLNLGGTAYTVDAACASSLIAIDHAMQELSTGRCDMVLAGGVHVCQNAAFWSIFTQLGALSRSQQIRPFDQRADGLLIGEGCGFVLLKRLDDAIRDGHRIYAVIKGVGVSSDGSGTSVMSPSVKGQSKAIVQAWENAGIDVAKVGYIEAHGTGTPLGDKTELETLLQVFGNNGALPKAGIGTVKSMIGHAMPAAGMAGLIKMAMALYHGKLPPTLHCDSPLESMAQTRFRPIQQAIDWDLTDLPKRAGVNAFGFGGINAHVVLEGLNENSIVAKKQFNGVSGVRKDDVLLLSRASKNALIKALEEGEKTLGEGNYRIALFDPTPDRIRKAINVVQRDLPWRNKQDIWFSNDPLISKGGKIAFLFPGLDGLKGGETDSVVSYFNLSKAEYQEAETDLYSTALKVVERSRILDSALKQLGIQPDLNAGHSLGEWLAARSSEIVKEGSVLTLMKHANPESLQLRDSKFLAVGCGYDALAPLLKEVEDIHLSIDNCPQQVILCGTVEAVTAFTAILRKRQIFHQVLPFQSGFHSPFVNDNLDQVSAIMDMMKFQKGKIPLWSATTVAPYPEDYEEIKKLNVAHLVKPVRFRELTEKLYQEGVSVFIQVGSGGLIGFVDDTLKNKAYSSIAANVPSRSGLGQLQRVIAALFVEGKEVDVSFLGAVVTKSEAKSTPMNVPLGLPLVGDLTSLKKLAISAQAPVRAKELALEEVAAPVMKAFKENCDEIATTQAEIIELFSKQNIYSNTAVKAKTLPGKIPVKRSPVLKPLDISLENSPYLIDHALLRQKPGWPCAEDLDPVIPMTMILEVFGEIAREHAPGEVVQKIANVRVFQWMNVAAPFRETITGEWKEHNRLFLNLERYANAEVVVSPAYDQPAENFFDIGAPLPVTVALQDIYTKNMFHGPAYQGIKEIKAFSEKGITGIIEGNLGKGSLLDNAGQLFGLWLQFILQKDKIAFPVKIQEVEFYSDMLDQQGRFECTCQLTELNDEFATANFIIKRNGQVWVIIRGWQNRRLEIDERLWNISVAPEYNLLSEEIAPGIFMFHNAYQRVVSWDFIVKRYFNQAEKKYYKALLPNKKKAWLISRVAVKDAIRTLLLQRKQEAYYPIEFEIKSDAVGKPFVEGEMTGGIHISLAHKNTDAVAIARYGAPVGIDIEEIQERSEGFDAMVFGPDELALIPSAARAEWVTRCWVAKEAYGKYLGKGLQGNPKAYVITAINGEELSIGDCWIRTIKHNNHIIGWTK